MFLLYTHTAQASDGKAEYLFQVGKAHHDGAGVPQDYAQAFEHYKQASYLGDSRAMINLGYMYFRAQGVPQDFAKARYWYERAVAFGDTFALKNLRMLDRIEGASPAFSTRTITTTRTVSTSYQTPTFTTPSFRTPSYTPASFHTPQAISMRTYTETLISKVRGSFPVPVGRDVKREPWLTACNRFVAHALKDAYGFDKFINPDRTILQRLGIKSSDHTSNSPNGYLRAEHIQKYMQQGNGWKFLGRGNSEQAMIKSSEMATLGYPTIAVSKGHVAVVLPGDPIKSVTWKTYVPYVASFRLGDLRNSFYYRPISYAWSPKSKRKVEFFYYDPSGR